MRNHSQSTCRCAHPTKKLKPKEKIKNVRCAHPYVNFLNKQLNQIKINPN